MLRVGRPGSTAGSPQAAAWALVVMSSLLAYLLTGQWGVIMATLSHSSAVGSSERCTSCEKVEVLYECKIIKLYCLLLVGCACVNLSLCSGLVKLPSRCGGSGCNTRLKKANWVGLAD